MTIATASSVTTHTVPARDRADYWRDLICNTFVELDCGRVGDGFYGELDAHPLGCMQLTRVRSSQHEALRSSRQIAKSSDDYFLISLQISGHGLVQQDGRTAQLRPGDFALYDSTRQYLLRFEGHFEELVLKLPRQLIADRIETPERITATSIDGRFGLGRLVFEYVCNLAAEIDQLSLEDRARLTGSLSDLLSGALSSGTDLKSIPTANSSSHLLRAKLLIAERLKQSDLCKESIAGQLEISTRHLSKLFSNESMTFSCWLREQRLSRIADDLSKPELAARSISAIAYSWGMNSMPHFSRVFRQHFDCTPRQYRRCKLASNRSH